MKRIFFILLLLQNLSIMNQETNQKAKMKVFPIIAYNLFSQSVSSNDSDDFIINYYTNIEQATRSYYSEFPQRQNNLFEELKTFCNDDKKSTKKLPEEEIKNILKLFLNDINNFEIKHYKKRKEQTCYFHIKSKKEAEEIYQKIITIKNQPQISNRILTKAINTRLNQLQQKYNVIKK